MAQTNNVTALRLDDVGACSKRYEVYSDHAWKQGRLEISANWLFLKYLPPFKKWGPYREIRPNEWRDIQDSLERYRAKITVAVTAAWAESEDRIIPFPQKYPEEAAMLKEGVKRGLIEIANHGLTHCVLANNAFKPRWFAGNRQYHREFWDWIPYKTQENHIRRSQEILQTYFETEVVSFVPPGNVFTDVTLEIAERHGLRYVSCGMPQCIRNQIVIVGEDRVLPFHDRDIVLSGLSWLNQLLKDNVNNQFYFIKELGQMILRFRKEIGQA